MPKTTTGGVNPGFLINYFRRKFSQNDEKIAPQTPQNGDFRLRRWWVNSPPNFVLGTDLELRRRLDDHTIEMNRRRIHVQQRRPLHRERDAGLPADIQHLGSTYRSKAK